MKRNSEAGDGKLDKRPPTPSYRAFVRVTLLPRPSEFVVSLEVWPFDQFEDERLPTFRFFQP